MRWPALLAAQIRAVAEHLLNHVAIANRRLKHFNPQGFMLEPRFSVWRNELYAMLRDEIRRAMAEQSGAPSAAGEA